MFKKFLPLLLFIILSLSIPAKKIKAQGQEVILEGVVTKIINEGEEIIAGSPVAFQELEIKITKGDKKNQSVLVKNSESSVVFSNSLEFRKYYPGDRLRLSIITRESGETSVFINGKLKRPGIFLLIVIFIATVIVVGRVWGALFILGLLTSFLIIFKFLIPSIIKGIHPVFAAVVSSLIIIPTTFYISHGFNLKTHIGVLATLTSLVFTGFLATYFVGAVDLTGFASEEAGFLQVERRGSIDIRGLLLAGIIIGTLGILDDVTVGQSSVVEQITKSSKGSLSVQELFIKGMKVGQDHISSMVNTLVLVYSGSALPLLLLFFDSQKTFIDIIEYELIAEEIVRMLVGSIGLVLAAPLATFFAALMFSKKIR